jgi:hypothetical protein
MIVARVIMSRRTRLVFKISIGIVATLAVTLALLIYRQERAASAWEILLHTKGGVRFSKLVIDSYDYGKPVRVVLTNQNDLGFLSSAFRYSTTNEAGGYMFFGYMSFADYHDVYAQFIIPEDVSFLAIGPTPLLLNYDPITYRIPLERPLPSGLDTSLTYLVHLH